LPGWADPGFADNTWEAAHRVATPTRHLQAQSLPPIKAVKTLKPVAVHEPKPGVFVYDLGQNFAGWARLRVAADRGTLITLRFAESVAADGMIDPASTGVFATHLVPTDTYITKGSGEEVWEPRFTYHGFRYVEMTGFPGTPSLPNLEGVVVHTALDEAGRFDCSDPMLKRIHETALWTEVSNLHGIPTDCPAREKCGWLGDAQVTAPMTIYNFDMARFWTKYLEDIQSSAEKELPTMVAPGKRSLGLATPDWGTAVVQIPWYVYLYYGDKRILERHYQAMRRWVDHLQQLSEGFIVSEGLGDWCPPGSVEPKETPVPLTSTAYFYLDTSILCEVAVILGRPKEQEQYRTVKEQIRAAFNREFLKAGSYGSQTADAFALRLGLAPEAEQSRIASSLARDVLHRHAGHLSTGITGIRCLYGELARYGYGTVALDILRQQTYPSIGYLFSQGATTFWETWGEPDLDRQHGPRSRNHAMQGAFDAWFYEGLGGIYPDPKEPGFKHTYLRPQVVAGLARVQAQYESIHGTIVSSWTFEKERFEWQVRVPGNTHATVSVPCDDPQTLTEGGRLVGQVAEISPFKVAAGRAILEIGSGEYNFASAVAVPQSNIGLGHLLRPWW
jgi:alpha-L-rhamnosidase